MNNEWRRPVLNRGTFGVDRTIRIGMLRVRASEIGCSLLLAFLVVFCAGDAQAGPVNLLMVTGSDGVSESDDPITYSYGPVTMSTQTQQSVSLGDASPLYSEVTSDIAALATYGVLHAAALATASTENIDQFGPTANSYGSAGASANDNLYFALKTGGAIPTIGQIQAFQNTSVVVMWRVDGKLELESAMAGESNIVTNLVNYTVGLGTKEAEVNISQNGGITPDGKTDFSQSGTLVSSFSQFNSATNTGSVTVSQSLGVSSSAFVIGGSPPPYDQSAVANANFQNTAQFVGIGLEDANGNILSPSDYSFSDDSGYAYALLSPKSVPEPSTWIMIGIAFGLVAPGVIRRRRSGKHRGAAESRLVSS